jgi:hypothetical protein
MTSDPKTPPSDGGNGHHGIVFFIGKKRFEAQTAQHTVREILTTYANEDPSQTTLALKTDGDPAEYTNPDQVIEIKNGAHFVVFHNTPTTVS